MWSLVEGLQSRDKNNEKANKMAKQVCAAANAFNLEEVKKFCDWQLLLKAK
jgi:hypothetical protein